MSVLTYTKLCNVLVRMLHERAVSPLGQKGSGNSTSCPLNMVIVSSSAECTSAISTEVQSREKTIYPCFIRKEL